MDEPQIKLKCLQLAIDAIGVKDSEYQALSAARDFYKWVMENLTPSKTETSRDADDQIPF